MRSHGIGQTDVGRQRTQNEDYYYLDDACGLYVVSDGMGGHAAGDVASRTAVGAVVRSIGEQWEAVDRYRRQLSSRAELASVCEQAVQRASGEVYQLATSRPGRAGMGCTLTMALVIGGEAAVSHVGDSRLYLCRAGIVNQLTSDHTVAAELLRAGLMTESEIHGHRYRHSLTRTVGTQPAVRVDTLVVDVLPDDILLLCTDGLSKYLNKPEDLAELLSLSPFDKLPGSLIDHANACGGKDNVTAIAVHIAAPDMHSDELRQLADRVQRRLDILSSIFIFKDLPMATLTPVLNACAIRPVAAGQIVLSEGDLCDGLFIVADGCFQLTAGTAVVGELRAGDYAAMTTLLHPRPARATMRAIVDSRLLHLNRSRFYWLLYRRPNFGVDLLERLGRQLSADLDRSIQQRGLDPYSLGAQERL